MRVEINATVSRCWAMRIACSSCSTLMRVEINATYNGMTAPSYPNKSCSTLMRVEINATCDRRRSGLCSESSLQYPNAGRDQCNPLFVSLAIALHLLLQYPNAGRDQCNSVPSCRVHA